MIVHIECMRTCIEKYMH